MGSVASTCVAELPNHSKNAPARERTIASAERNPSRLRWKNIWRIGVPMNDGSGFVSSSPALRWPHSGTCSKTQPPVPSGRSWCGIVAASSVVLRPGLRHSS